MKVVALASTLPSDKLPTEFQIFEAGTVSTTKGDFIFDAAAAKSVMDEYQLHGTELFCDFDHASLAASPTDPALSGRAAGWFGLELRDGALWAVGVKWTPAAAEALANKEFRYQSPAFTETDGHITSLLNVALTNLPATRNLTPLVAASKKEQETMDSQLVTQALDALIEGDEAKCMDLLKQLVASAAGATNDDAPPSSEAGGPPSSSQAPAPPPKGKAKKGAPKPDAEDGDMVAASAKIIRMTNTRTLAAAAVEIAQWRASHVELEVEKQKLAQERKVLDAAARRKLCRDLVVHAGRAPATVWASSDPDAPPKAAYAKMSIGDLKEYVASAVATAGGKRLSSTRTWRGPTPPPGSGEGSGAHGLSRQEEKAADEAGCDHAVFARLASKRNPVLKGGQ